MKRKEMSDEFSKPASDARSGGGGGGRAGLKDIAALAGVSLGSVSSVLNNRHLERRITHETAQAIRKAAAQLGYLPNIGARKLRGGAGAKNTILLALITSFEAPIPLIDRFIIALRREVEASRFAQSDYTCSVMIEMFTAGRLREMPGILTGDHFNAAIILNTVPEDDVFLARSHLPYPAVLVNRLVPGYSSVVEPDDCGLRPAEVFAQRKRSHLAVLHGSPLTQITQNRVNTFIRRAQELTGRAPAEIVADKLSEAGGYEAMRAWLNGEGKDDKRRQGGGGGGGCCDGLYAVSDALAMGAYQALREHGLAIPRNVAVIGVGDYQVAPFFDPPLSCIGVSHTELAELASRQLIKSLTTPDSPPETIHAALLENLRGSTGHGK
ncbi:LacI family DNA-binding transcriptional regulator [Geminisphaera colitermitum]|uniref:LacI family DNA-binding transcriptional regulator n=1 Tax=Geminisphaera colitermitum TaxID=1148786 RepID=UPI000158CE55|nr:LacI family DNA-binding transcriptional regulator [Geminisphaera colitermitum]